jgi:hypothetical protein
VIFCYIIPMRPTVVVVTIILACFSHVSWSVTSGAVGFGATTPTASTSIIVTVTETASSTVVTAAASSIVVTVAVATVAVATVVVTGASAHST